LIQFHSQSAGKEQGREKRNARISQPIISCSAMRRRLLTGRCAATTRLPRGQDHAESLTSRMMWRVTRKLRAIAAAHSITLMRDPHHRIAPEKEQTVIVPLTLGAVMVAKCSNPSCSASFRYFKEGRLFRLENDPTLSSASVSTTEYFWLCRSCSSTVTLRLNDDGKVTPVVLAELVQQSGYFNSAIRQSGRLLSDVSFSIERRHGSAGFID
jgi:hypothetical protein